MLQGGQTGQVHTGMQLESTGRSRVGIHQIDAACSAEVGPREEAVLFVEGEVSLKANQIPLCIYGRRRHRSDQGPGSIEHYFRQRDRCYRGSNLVLNRRIQILDTFGYLIGIAPDREPLLRYTPFLRSCDPAGAEKLRVARGEAAG
jgi:hypothetical protein